MRFQAATALFCIAAAVNINEAQEQHRQKPTLLSQTGTGFRWMTPEGETGGNGKEGEGQGPPPPTSDSDAKVNINIGRIDTLNMQL